MNRVRALLVPIALAIVSLSGWAQSSVPPAGAEPSVLRAGDFNLSKADYERLVLGFERAAGAPVTGATPQSVQSGQEVGRLLAMVSEAQRRKIDQDPKIAELMRVRGYTLLANALLVALTDEVKKDEAGTRAVWESEKNNYIEIKARQILVRYKGVSTDKPGMKGTARTESTAKAEASALHAKLVAGANFAELAKKHSDDDSTRASGGELPAFSRGAMVSEFEAAAFAVPVGKFSEPFKTKYGYYLIEVTERRPYPFERVRATLEFARARQKLEAIASTGFQLSETYFKP